MNQFEPRSQKPSPAEVNFTESEPETVEPVLSQYEVEILSEAYRNSQDPDYDKQYNYGHVYQSTQSMNTWEELKQWGLLTYATNRYWNITTKGRKLIRSLGA